MISARAPAKLIISGEHAVLYGQPAIAVAINKYTTASVAYNFTQTVNIILSELQTDHAYNRQTLNTLGEKLDKNYQLFLDSRLNINSVLDKPSCLIAYAVYKLLQERNYNYASGIDLKLESNIPLGSGMGSSAAAVLSTIVALNKLLGFDTNTSELLELACVIENLQHGRSSGIDLNIIANGGCIFFQQGVTRKLTAKLQNLYIVNTGIPESNTGECVAAVSKQLANDHALLQEFAEVTNLVEQALIHDSPKNLLLAIRENNRLLQKISVVPPRVAEFISEIESQGGAAKICGAGAVAGDNAGIVLLMANKENNFVKIVNKYNYQLQAIELDTNGTQLI
jgi:mevalonate kinase